MNIVGYYGEKRSTDKPQKRKILRKIKAEICSRNMANPDMEKAARSQKRVLAIKYVQLLLIGSCI